MFDVIKFNIKSELLLYDTVLNEICARIDHDNHEHIYHGCEFVREIIYRQFEPVSTRYTALPAYVIPTFLNYINDNDCSDLDFCNFLCCRDDRLNIYTPSIELYPAELDNINMGTSRVIFTRLKYTLSDYKSMVYNFLYKLSENCDVLPDELYRKLIYKMAKIFKHKTRINDSDENSEKVVVHFNECVTFLIQNKEKFRIYENLVRE